ncbi:MAG: DUF2203 family protein [Deltaproteobacteria bacterium]|nr:DUF2203 family protein [Deltaproteobacteria bacterium]
MYFLVAMDDAERANRMIPELEAIFAEIDAAEKEVVARANELERMGYAASRRLHGDDDPPEIADRRKYLEDARRKLAALPLRFDALGVVLLDLSLSVVGFRSTVRGEPVFLMWQRGDKRVEFYTPVDAEISERRRLGPSD